MIQQEEEGENISHSHISALPTGCLPMLGWRQLSCTPSMQLLMLLREIFITTRDWNHVVFPPKHSVASHKDSFLLYLTT